MFVCNGIFSYLGCNVEIGGEEEDEEEEEGEYIVNNGCIIHPDNVSPSHYSCYELHLTF